MFRVLSVSVLTRMLFQGKTPKCRWKVRIALHHLSAASFVHKCLAESGNMLIMALSYTQWTNDMSLLNTYVRLSP